MSSLQNVFVPKENLFENVFKRRLQKFSSSQISYPVISGDIWPKLVKMDLGMWHQFFKTFLWDLQYQFHRSKITSCGTLPCFACVGVVKKDFLVGQASVVSKATHNRLDRPGIESRWVQDFPQPSRPALGPTQGLFLRATAAGAWHWPPTPI